MESKGISKSKIARYSQLKSKKGRLKEGLFMVQGEKSVDDTLGFFDLETLIISRDFKGDVSKYCSYRFVEASCGDMKKISSLNDVPEIIAVYRLPSQNVETGYRFDGLEKFILLLDGIQDPGNFGTIVRTAHWFGIDRIYCSPDCVDLYNPKVIQSTMGSIAKVRICYCDLESLIVENPEIPVYGLFLDGDNIFESKEFKKGFIVMGSEGHGISDEVSVLVKSRLTIPPVDPLNHPESLNVAIATAITLSQIIR